MAITNHERVGEALDLPRQGLAPFVEREVQSAVKAGSVRMVEWQASRPGGQDALAARASKKPRNAELLVTTLAGTFLRHKMDQIPLWRGAAVAIRPLIEDFPPISIYPGSRRRRRDCW
jgi:hypothetical protein